MTIQMGFGARLSVLGSLLIALALSHCKVDSRSPELADENPVLGGADGGSGGSGAGAAGAGGTRQTPGPDGGQNAAGAGGTVDPRQMGGGYFTSGAWHGYAWTGVDTEGLSSVAPTTFADLAPGAPYCFEGSVGADPPSTPTATDGSRGVALLGLNINQQPGTTATEPGPVLETVPAALGIAVNILRSAPPANSGLVAAPVWRLQIQDLSGQSWCAPLPTADGAAFIRYEPHAFDTSVAHFRKNCWDTVGSVPYEREPISSVVLSIPGGSATDYYFNGCLSGLADTGEEASGEIDARFARAKVVVGGESYVINNNAWGSTSVDGSQRILFANNGFEIIQQTADPTPDGSPISFPSIYIGRNGLQSGFNGATTSDTDNLPIQVSSITSIPTRFRHNADAGDYNATYELWFSPSPPSGEYDSAQGAYVMIWAYKPGNREPIGTRGSTVTVENRVWAIYTGPRGGAGPDANVPVISFVNEGEALLDCSFDLNQFIRSAVSRSLGVTDDMFLTDIFGGFEIWDEGPGVQLLEFTAIVNP